MKQHYKMFKKGKNWCCMAIATLSVAVGALSISQHNVNADTTETEASSISTNIENTQNLSENTVSLTTSVQNQDLQTKTADASTTQNINKTQGQNPQAGVQTQAQSSAENYAVVSPKAENSTSQSGWQTENGNSYYYRDGQKLIGQQNIDGKDYYFNDQGQQQKDYFLNQNNHTYYFQADGTRLNDGFYNNWGHTYYFQADGSRLDNGFYNNWGHTYYFQADGSRLDNGFYNNWGHTYYFQADGSRLDNGFYNNWGHTYYFGSDGALTTNKDIIVNGVNYRADNSGVLTSPEFSINYTYSLANGEGSNQIAANDYIIMHDVGVESGAAANARYFKNNWQSVYAYTQFVVGDGGQVFEVGQPGYVSWGALAANPYSPVQIELGRTYNRSQFIRDYTTYINVARYYATIYNIPLTLDAGNAGTRGVKTHNWVTQNIGGSHVDPYGYLASWGITRNQFANDIANGINAQQLNSVVYYSRK